MGKIFEGLNKEQEEAVRHISGPLLILAGAGSGKTRVLTCRTAVEYTCDHLYKQGRVRNAGAH